MSYKLPIKVWIPDFKVNTVILNVIDISRRWCKFNFRPWQGQVKSCHFCKRIDSRRHYCYFLYKCLEIIVRKWLGQNFWRIIWVYYYLLNGCGLDLYKWIALAGYEKYPTLLHSLDVWFFTLLTSSDHGKSNLTVLLIA